MSATVILCLCLVNARDAGDPAPVRVTLVEGIADKKWDFATAAPAEQYFEPAFGFVAVPKKYTSRGVIADRSNPYLLRATTMVELAPGDWELLLRAHNAARLYVDGRLVAETGFLKGNADGHEDVPEPKPVAGGRALRLLVGHEEQIARLTLDGGPHEVRLDAIIGGSKLRQELGELLVGIARTGERFRLLGAEQTIELSDTAWDSYAAGARSRMAEYDIRTRRAAAAGEAKYWAARHDLARRDWQQRPAPAVPRVADQAVVHNDIDRFIAARLEAAGVRPAPLADDWTFLRRVSLDTVGVIPSSEEVAAFERDRGPQRRPHVIDRLLADSRWADHWVGYWQDVLAENPGILKPTLNNSGPFRWWLYESFQDNKPMDWFASELVEMAGSAMGGGPAGFGIATQNDAPMAAKAHILGKAFLGIELQCARCHDAPYHPFEQRDVFSFAAMLARAPQKVPATSSVPKTERTRRPLVQITLEPGSAVEPVWPFDDLAPAHVPEGMLRHPSDARERAAVILTSPRNARFAQVLVNRLWKRYLGWGLVEPVDDWLDPKPSHPELLDYLARELVTHDYDLKHVARLILNSHTYQRAVQADAGHLPEPAQRLFASPARRRLSAEQLVDSLFVAAGKELGSEELNFDVDGRRPISEFINLGQPRRAWQMTSLSNERDRPALALPVAQSIVDILTAYGWRDSRQNPITVREETATPLQPLVLAHGTVGSRIAQLSEDSALTDLALAEQPLPALVRAVFLQLLTRPPRADEVARFAELLEPGYATRRVGESRAVVARRPARAAAVSWSNHLSPEATRLKLEQERVARAGDPPTERLHSDWRERMEDMVWALVNSPEFVFVP